MDLICRRFKAREIVEELLRGRFKKEGKEKK